MALKRYHLAHAQFGQSGLLALPKGLPLVVTFRGDDLQGMLDPNGRITLAGRLLQLVSQGVARCADATIVVSEHMKPFLHASVPTHVIPSGLDFGLFRPIPQDEARRHLGLRSEEHTSELQSQSNLVCRLLLEKKKKNTVASA